MPVDFGYMRLYIAKTQTKSGSEYKFKRLVEGKD